MKRPITEKTAVQKPFVKYAREIGWKEIAQDEALFFRKGSEGKVFYEKLKEKLISFNKDFIGNDEALEIIRKLEAIQDTIEGNRQILSWLRGEQVFYDQEEKRSRNVQMIDFTVPDNNSFFVTEEWEHIGGRGKKNRADIVMLINGIPIAIIENKNPRNKDAIEAGVSQLTRYERETPEMLSCPQIFNVTHIIEYFYGVTWNYSRKNIFNWKKDLEGKRKKDISLQNAVKSFFEKQHFLKTLKDWIVFFFKENELQKTLLKQHQTRAVLKILDRCDDKEKNRGLIWHTQGSGKTFTMITAARIILEDRPNATVMLIIDRNELEGQLEGWIDSLLKENDNINIKKAGRKAELQEILSHDFRGLIVTMIHKFDKIRNDICTKDNFYILIDEAHRSINKDLGTYMMAAIPNATIFGFTGTPIDRIAQGKGTFKIFGSKDKKGYLDKYSIQESIDDGTTLKLRHTSVDNEMTLSEDLLEEEFLKNADAEGVSDIEDLNNVLQRAVKIRTFLKSDDHIKKSSEYIYNHFETKVKPLGYKAFVVAVDREACALYKQELDKHFSPESTHIVYTTRHNDPRLLSQYAMSKDKETTVRKSFKHPKKGPEILIVTDKLLTGYDAPILYCMYLDKPMRDHVLLQAIARVNRPYEDDKGINKPCGLIVDFVGIFKSMHKALAFDSDEVNAVIEDIEVLLGAFIIKVEKLKKSIKEQGRGDTDVERLVYEEFADPEKRKNFLKETRELESMYEILSPDKKLSPYLDDYGKVIEVRQLLHNAYGDKTRFLGELSRKTAELIRERAKTEKVSLGETIEINEATLSRIQDDKQTSDSVKIMNLIKAIINASKEKKKENPTLLSIAEKAQNVLDQFKEDQSRSKEYLESVLELTQNVIDADKEQANSGLDKDTFTIYWELQNKITHNAKKLSIEINYCFNKFEHFRNSMEEMRQLRVELYKLLISHIKGPDIKETVNTLIKLRRSNSEG